MRPLQAVIHTAALRANVCRIREYAPHQKVMAVVKADGYGSGAVTVAKSIENQVDAFAVSCIEEALVLRAGGVRLPILLLEGFFSPDELPIIVEQNFHVVIHCFRQISYLQKSSLAQPLFVWLKVDTGMRRLGFHPAEFKKAYELLRACPAVQGNLRVMTHFACADDRQSGMTREQVQRFRSLVGELPCEQSLANSAGIMAWAEGHGQWVRPGIMLYGVSPFGQRTGIQEGLQPVMVLQSALISQKLCRRGESVGYGATWKAPQTMPIGVVAVGYADGYPRHLPTGTPVLVNGKRVPLIGRVSMDMIMVDLRLQPNAKMGDPVELWGHGLPIEEVAAHAGTIAYELLCGVAARVPRVVRE